MAQSHQHLKTATFQSEVGSFQSVDFPTGVKELHDEEQICAVDQLQTGSKESKMEEAIFILYNTALLKYKLQHKRVMVCRQ